jgi:hypothetical protein
MRGDPTIVIDNIVEPITGAKLLSVLTQQVADLRPLGSSRLIAHDTRALFLFNGNNLTIPGHMCRRVLACSIDPACEHPEQRPFEFDPLGRVKQERGRYVIAALTILRAHFVDRRPAEIRALAKLKAALDTGKELARRQPEHRHSVARSKSTCGRWAMSRRVAALADIRHGERPTDPPPFHLERSPRQNDRAR